MNQPAAFSFTGRIRSVRYALRGLRLILLSQHNAWVHFAATIGVVLVGLLCRLSNWEWCLIVSAITVVWMAESLNTAFEFLCDVASPDFHPMVEKSKDAAAGAVLLGAMGSVVVGLLVFVPHLIKLFT
jgi:diacylglycerol kinase (ATP)